MFIAGSHEWLKTNGYRAERVAPMVWAIFDQEDEREVCRGSTHAEVVRSLIALRFPE